MIRLLAALAVASVLAPAVAGAQPVRQFAVSYDGRASGSHIVDHAGIGSCNGRPAPGTQRIGEWVDAAWRLAPRRRLTLDLGGRRAHTTVRGTLGRPAGAREYDRVLDRRHECGVTVQDDCRGSVRVGGRATFGLRRRGGRYLLEARLGPFVRRGFHGPSYFSGCPRRNGTRATTGDAGWLTQDFRPVSISRGRLLRLGRGRTLVVRIGPRPNGAAGASGIRWRATLRLTRLF